MIVRKFVSDLRTIVSRAQMEEAITIAKGGCASHEEYKKRCGFISGMERTLLLAEEQLKKIDGDEDVGEAA